MASNQEKIKELEAELSKTKYNKRTQRSIGILKAKIAQLRSDVIKASSKKAATSGYSMRKSGDATVALVGFPSVGKSTLLNVLTNADSEVGAYEFTTLDVIPGTMEYNEAKIQILDIPGIIAGAASGKGRGREIIQVARSSNLVVLLTDVFRCETIDVIKKELFKAGIRLDQKPPDVQIRRKQRGGLQILTTVPLTNISEDEIRDILAAYRIINGQILLREDINVDQLIDVMEKSRVYIPSLLIVNKVDQITHQEVEKLRLHYRPDLFVSANDGLHIEELRKKIFDKLALIRIYCKEKGKKPDMTEPLIMKDGSTVKHVCAKLHKDFVSKFMFVRIWGKSVKFPGQKMQLKHVLKDGDILEIHTK